MGGFDRDRRSGRLIGTFTGFEADLLRSFAGQLIELLRNERAAPTEPEDPLEALLDFSGPVDEPDDPVLRRLLPAAYEDPEAAGEFRRYTETTLRDGKAAGAAAIIDALEDAGLPPEVDEALVLDIELAEADAQIWLRSLNDLRLAIATRLEIDDESSGAEDFADDDPRAFTYGVYEWLGELQYTLVEALSG